jgi:hypothetical protein
METKSRSGRVQTDQRSGSESALRARWSKQDRQTFWINEYFNTASNAGLSPDEASAFEGEHHLVDRERRQ